jgi:RNA polymerase sigma-70 factor (sigma-E family)
VGPVDEAEFRQFIVPRIEPLRRTAYLLCRDWHTADDLVAITVAKLVRHWRRVRQVENADAYARRVLTRAWLDERRRPWRRESPTADLPEPQPLPGPDGSLVADRTALLDLLTHLPPQRRAVVVLRFYCDMSVQDTAQALGISEGTVKSQASRGLAALRLLAVDQNGVEGR